MQKTILKSLLVVSIQLSVFSLQLAAQTEPDVPFAAGVDISWCTEMEADGMKFYDLSGNETEIYSLMKSIGMTATRIRVWVNPESSGPNGTAYGPWSNKADVVAKAKRAAAAGLDILIDFHYSDYFADPGKQAKPAAWANYDFAQTQAAVADHTRDVLGAIKAEGITVKWVQVGNETSGGMVYDDGRILWNTSSLAASWKRYADLSNAGYDAVKEIYPDAMVIVHHDQGEKDNSSYYQTFKQYGGKFDMIGLSYYPDWSDWEATNTLATKRLQSLYKTFRVPVMVVETGSSTWDTSKADGEEQTGDSEVARQVFEDLFTKMMAKSGCRGIFYWEPEVYGGWSHNIDENGVETHDTGTYGEYHSSHGAFNMYGQPAIQLLAWRSRKDTPVENVVSDKQPSTKVIRDGQLLIERGGQTFTVLGNRIQ